MRIVAVVYFTFLKKLDQHCSDARLLMRLGGILSGAEITSFMGICGSSDVVNYGERMSCAAE
jgi:hypothetical protein